MLRSGFRDLTKTTKPSSLTLGGAWIGIENLSANLRSEEQVGFVRSTTPRHSCPSFKSRSRQRVAHSPSPKYRNLIYDSDASRVVLREVHFTIKFDSRFCKFPQGRQRLNQSVTGPFLRTAQVPGETDDVNCRRASLVGNKRVKMHGRYAEHWLQRGSKCVV